jgi:antirestriction protein
MFEQEHTDAIVKFYSTYPRYADIERFRTLRTSVKAVRNIFYTVVRINAALRDAAAKTAGCFFLDYHAAVRDESGQLAVECAAADGTHVTFEAYCRMAAVVRAHLVA